MSSIISNTGEDKPTLLASTIILFIASLFMPFILVFLLQDFLYHSKSHWFFVTPASAYITFHACSQKNREAVGNVQEKIKMVIDTRKNKY